MIYKALFLHGFFNSGQCEMAKALRDCLTEELRAYDDMYAEDEVEVICPDLPPNPYDALGFISEIVEGEKVDVVVGNSCGAMYAHIIASEYGLPCLVGNPYYKMSEFLRERIGEHTYKTERKDGKQKLVIDGALVEAFQKLENEQRVFRNADGCKSFVWGIFGEQDKLTIVEESGVKRNKHERLFLKHYSLSFHFPGGHTPTYEETKTHHVPLAACLIREFAYYRRKQQEGESMEDKRHRLGVEYTHEFSQFYIAKMAQLAEAKDFYRCDIEGDNDHIIYRYRPEGKDTPYYVNADGSVMYDFLIEYHRGKPSEGIYYGCKAEILHGDMENHAEGLRQLWPNIFLKGKENCNPLQRELTEILNNTFQWKDFFKCYKPTDNIREQRYWLFWVTLCDDEDINDVAAVATKLMAMAFGRQFRGECTDMEDTVKQKKGKGRPSKSVEERFNSTSRQNTHYTEAAYRRLVDKLGEGRGLRKATFFFYDEEKVNQLMQYMEDEGIISLNPKYEKAWVINGPYSKFKENVAKLLKNNAAAEFGEKFAWHAKFCYPEELDSLLMDSNGHAVGKNHG